MKTKLILILAASLLLTGCTTIQKQIEGIMEVVDHYESIEYHMVGVTVDIDLTIHDGVAHYKRQVKAPGGPSATLTITKKQSE